VRGGLEGSERLITVLFVDLRGSTDLSESKMPYDLLYILNQFFHEMTRRSMPPAGTTHNSLATG
jgi:adenylate cyclase